MPVHDWKQVDAGTFHAFHTAWITHLSEALNGGVLPSGYYALPEQHAGRFIADVLTLQAQDRRAAGAGRERGRGGCGISTQGAPQNVRILGDPGGAVHSYDPPCQR